MKKFLLICISVMTFFAMSVTSFASSYNAPSTSSTNDGYIIYKTTTGVRCVVYNSSDWTPTMKYVWNAQRGEHELCLVWTSHRDTPYVRYSSTTYSNGSWGTLSQFDQLAEVCYKYSGVNMSDYIYDSKYTIYDDSDNVVFQVTPPLEEVVRLEMEELPKTLGGVMKTITLCGVGCLALLIGCSLLRKKSVLWLNR